MPSQKLPQLRDHGCEPGPLHPEKVQWRRFAMHGQEDLDQAPRQQVGYQVQTRLVDQTLTGYGPTANSVCVITDTVTRDGHRPFVFGEGEAPMLIWKAQVETYREHLAVIAQR